jgi:alpha-D-xyloside xylohydrolase
VLYSDSYDYDQFITGLSTASLCGVLWGPEIRNADSPDEWLARMQLTCFGPLAQLNAWASGTKPWEYPSVVDGVRDVICLRLRLLPYIYSAFADYQHTGKPPIRAMLLEESFDISSQQDTKSIGAVHSEKNPYEEMEISINDFSDQFMFGPDLLIAPWKLKDGNICERTVMIPKGEWFDFYSGAYIGNGESVRLDPSQCGKNIPIFVRNGAVIPMIKDKILNSEQAYGATLQLRHYGNASGFCSIYEDDGISFDHEQEMFRYRKCTVSLLDGKWGVYTSISGKGPQLYGEIQGVKHVGK